LTLDEIFNKRLLDIAVSQEILIWTSPSNPRTTFPVAISRQTTISFAA
jgi:hypothetical protein